MNINQIAEVARKSARQFHEWYLDNFDDELGCEDKLTECIKAAIEKATAEIAKQFVDMKAYADHLEIKFSAAHASDAGWAMNEQGEKVPAQRVLPREP